MGVLAKKVAHPLNFYFMKKLLVLNLLCIIYASSFCQIRRDAVWCFGDSVQIDFNQNPPSVGFSAVRARGSVCSISDSTGNLLFYSHTSYIPEWISGNSRLGVLWNNNHQVMENGDKLNGEGWYKEMVIIPNPSNSQIYYLFHTDVTVYRKLYYSVIDLSYNGGLGKVIQKNVLVDSLTSQGLSDGLVAVKHGNGRDWWLIFRPVNIDGTSNNTINAILIAPTGIGPIQSQNIGLLTNSNIVRLFVNHEGSKIILTNVAGLTEYYDFDRCTGLLSNLVTLNYENYNSSTFYRNYNWSAEFSPNDEILFISTLSSQASFLYQYDLTASNIRLTKLLLDSLVPPSQGGDLKLAADDKIYWAAVYDTGPFPFPYDDTIYNQYNMNLSVINQPNMLGQACDFQKYSFYLGGHRVYYGLPNNPNYDMIAKGGSICDTLGLPNDIEKINALKNISVYPNPASNEISLLSLPENFRQIHVSIYDLTGKLVLDKILDSDKINIQHLNEGIYLMQILLNDQIYASKKFSVVR